MARTTVGAQLTEQHKADQVALRAGALRAFMRLWPSWRGDEASFQLLVDAVIPLVREQHRASAERAAEYFTAFRRAERAGGTARPVLPEAPLPARIAGTLYVVARDMTREALAAGQPPEAAMKTALVRTSGSVGTLVMEGGRTTIVESTAADRAARGWARATSANCCDFCAMLASRGPVYGAATVRFEAHDHCACTAEPSYSGADWPPNATRFREIWDQDARPHGADARRKFRQALAALRAAPSSPQ